MVETAMAVPRLFLTIRDARRFSASSETLPHTDGQARFRMRAAMDLDPRLGKWVSRRSVWTSDVLAERRLPSHASRLIDPTEIPTAVESICRDGFYVFAHLAPEDFTTAIREFAEGAPSSARGAGTPLAPYPRTNPEVGRYDIDEQAALACPEVQEYVTDPAMAAIAREYLGQPVLMDEVALWWTTSKRSEDANINAQMFHQDRDRLSFLKYFIYLTDVTSETGPHVYLRGSHGYLPPSLRGDGRKDDEAVRTAGLWGNVSEIVGPAGSLMAVDSIGLHKGKTPIAGDRLALEIEFATSLFGAAYERPRFVPTPTLKERYLQMPWVLQRYAPSVAR